MSPTETLAAARAYLADRQVPMPQAHDLAFTLVCSDDLLRCTVQLLVDLLGSAEIDPPPPGPMQ